MKPCKFLLTICLFAVCAINAQEPLYDYVIFRNSAMGKNYFFSKVITSGATEVDHDKNRLRVSETEFHSPGNSLQLSYQNKKNASWKVIISRQNIRGQDFFRTPRFLSFWIKSGDRVTTSLPTVSLLLTQRKGRQRDSTYTKAVAFEVSKAGEWIEILIPLEKFGLRAFKPTDLAAVVFNQRTEVTGLRKFFIDDIVLRANNVNRTPTSTPVLTDRRRYPRHIDLTWQPCSDSTVKYIQIYRAVDKGPFNPVGIQVPNRNRYADFLPMEDSTELVLQNGLKDPGSELSYKIVFVGDGGRQSTASNVITTKAYPSNMIEDSLLLTMIQEASFRYYWDEAEKVSGLSKENTLGRQNMIASGASGFGMMALIVGTERKFISRTESANRFIKIVNFLDQAETFHGVFPHFIDGPTGKVEPFFGQRDNGGDLVETSFLMQGLLAARAYFKNDDPQEKVIRDKITKIWERIEWDWYRRYPDSKFLYWHWSPDKAWVINHRLIGWNETMITYLLAIASPTHAVPASLYYSGWANQDSTGQDYRKNWGGTADGSMYTNGNSYFGVKLDVGVSNGGPLFFTHYSYLGYDPHKITDKYTNYFDNNKNIALINYRYCQQNPGRYLGYGDSCWGLTASDGPYNYSADEPVLRQDKGKIGPTGAISSFPYTPVESMQALKNYYFNYGKFLWGEYGFRDAFNLTENWCSDIYMGLNQAPMTVMIENYRTGLIWNLLMSDKDVQAGLQRLAKEK
jgi:hypothetical protein